MCWKKGHKKPFWCVALWCLLSMTGCAIDDDRDICCGNVWMEYKYYPYGVEELTTYIHSMRHFLFDSEGRFVCEIMGGSDLSHQRFSLSTGDYTMVTLGNADQPLAFDASDHTLQSLEMELTKCTPSGKFLNADQLYWGFCPMHIEEQGEQRFVTYMNNIHCHLYIRVLWHNMPSDVGDYRMELHRVPVGYKLSPDQIYTVDDKVMPVSNGDFQTYVQRTPLKAQELQEEFVTLRYNDDTIPYFQLWFGDKAVTDLIDLGRAFQTWGWRPEATAVQEYRIQMTIYSNGTVEVKPWMGTDVEDWQDGGSFG